MAEKNHRRPVSSLITGAGHWPQWEQSDTFNRIVLRFLTES